VGPVLVFENAKPMEEFFQHMPVKRALIPEIKNGHSQHCTTLYRIKKRC